MMLVIFRDEDHLDEEYIVVSDDVAHIYDLIS
jgi:hypothetical protein